MEEEDFDFFLNDELELLENDDLHSFSDCEYWNKRYTINKRVFDWYENLEYFWRILNGKITTQGIALNIGCGTSNMSKSLLNIGFTKVISTDISEVAINIMKNKFKSIKELEWVVDDCRKMSFESDSFDCVFEKGITDSLICCDKPSLPLTMFYREVMRVLKPGGFFVLITYGPPEDRLKYFKKSGIFDCYKESIEVQPKIARHTPHYVYLLVK